MTASASIPVEICYAILDELACQYTWSTETRRYILACSQVSNTFRSYLLPRLFKDAPCYSSRCIQTLHDLLVANPCLATCIKSFSLVRGGKGSKWSRDVNWLAKDASLPLVVHLLSNNIEELTLETSIDCGHLAWACLRGHVKAALRTLVSSPSLKSLSIKYFQVSRDLIELISSSVEHLTLEGAQLANSSSNADLQPRGASQLRTLTLWHSPLPFDLLLHSFQEHGFPQLQTVEVKDRGLLEGDLRDVLRLVPMSPKLRVLKTDTKNFFRYSPARIKSTSGSSPFTSLVISCPHDPSFATTVKSLTQWLSMSLEMDYPPAPLPATPSPPGSPSLTFSMPSHLAPTATAGPINAPSQPFSLPPRSTLTNLSIEFNSINTHLSRDDTALRLCGQIDDVKDSLRLLKELVNQPGYASIEEVVLDFKSFGLTERQGALVREVVLENLDGRSEAMDASDSNRSKFVVVY